ncbi:hypothetical protein [Solimonas terrae]|uniref:Uncharacterized protein n=1 Tax=Solimonas terrae TaxID=1396819 RepID=A0A6M2BJV2_9GAMM|nr:hypothetical protein [Solimonas terrae]NGY03222.1 hypothetical protein [Solimonas terrae]
MPRMKTALRNDLRALQLVRDELLLHLHLLGADVNDRWQVLERQWDSLKEHAHRAQTAAESARPEIETAAGLLAEALRRGYAEIGNALKR